ncbi:MAG: pilus assembly protein PilM [Myxococcales bacterium]|nr:pilus assembly protein PilM [Myxococcales bacterium]
MAQKIIGLDLGSHAVKAVLVSTGLRSVQVLDVHEEPISARQGGEDPLDAALEVALAVLRRRGWIHYPVAVVLPGTLGSYRLLKFPFPDARRIGQAVVFEADGQFPVSLEALEHDHMVLPPHGNEGRALVVATRQELIARVSTALSQAHIDVKLVTVSPLALAQVMVGTPVIVPEAESGEESSDPVTLVVDIGHRSTEMLALGAKGPYTARVLRRGGVHVTRALAKVLDVDLARAETYKLKEAFLPAADDPPPAPEALRACRAVAQALEPLVRELEHTRIWLRAEYGYAVTSIRLMGGGSRLRGLSGYLQEQLELPVSAGEIQPVGGLRKHTGRDWTQAAAALGGAVGAHRRPMVQLFTEAASGAEAGGWLLEKLPTVAAMGLAIIAFGALDTMARLSALDAQEQAYRAELGDATESVFGEKLYDETAIQARLSAVGGQDLTSFVAKRGAVEILATIVKASTPEGPKPAAGAAGIDGAPVDPATGMPITSGPGLVNGHPVDDVSPYSGPLAGRGYTITGPDGEPVGDGDDDDDEEGEGEEAAIGPGPDSGIAWDDELYFKAVDIRPMKIAITASALRTSAKERLDIELKSKIACIKSISSGGKTRSENDRKVWEFEIDHDCFHGQLEGQS